MNDVARRYTGAVAAAAAAAVAVVDVAPVVVVVALPLENAENSPPAFLDDTQGRTRGCQKIFADKLFGIAKHSLSKGIGKSC